MAAAVGTTFTGIPAGIWQKAFPQDRPAAEKATLEIRVRDHRAAIGDFARLVIAVDGLRISSQSGLKSWQIGWKELKPALEKIDLTQYTGKRSAPIFRGEMAAGAFEAMDLKVKGIEGTLKKNKKLVHVKDLISPIQVRFSLHPKEVTLIVLDLAVMDMSDHPSGAYELHIKGYERYSNGKLVDKAPPG